MKIDFLKFRKIYYIFSGILVVASIVSIFSFGLKPGIDFTGGSVMELSFSDSRPSNKDIEGVLNQFNLGDFTIQPTGDKGVIIKMKEINEETHQSILKSFPGAEEKQFEFIGPSVGQELKQTTMKALFLALIAIAIYIAFAFRKISRPVPSWQYGIATVIGLSHNILIPLGVFAYLGKFYNIEITIPIIAALLTILAFSVHDNIVIFDRIRENLLKRGTQSFEETVNFSLNQTLGRSINTVLTVLFVLFAILFFGGETLRYFSLAIIIGITFGAYSSICIASPLLITWYKNPKKIDKH
jgi:preprotein translocase subunit SecF